MMATLSFDILFMHACVWFKLFLHWASSRRYDSVAPRSSLEDVFATCILFCVPCFLFFCFLFQCFLIFLKKSCLYVSCVSMFLVFEKNMFRCFLFFAEKLRFSIPELFSTRRVVRLNLLLKLTSCWFRILRGHLAPHSFMT